MTPVLWSYADLVTATRGRLVGMPSASVRGISIDSRTVGAGDAFFAIAGDRFDGHDFATAALKAGAAIAVVAEARLSALGTRGPFLAVPDVLAALVDLGIASRARSGARIVAVTGSVGKTGTKEALRLVLARAGETHASVASFNNHWGVPLTLARMPVGAQFGVFEIGMNHAGEITPLTGYVRPHVAIVTTVEPVHLEFFANIEGIAEAKAEIFLGLEPDGAAIINRDNPHFDLLEKRAQARGVRIVSFGAHPLAQARLVEAAVGPERSRVTASILGEPVTYELGAPGRHVVQNSLAVLAAARLLGADLARSADALAHLVPPKGRGERQRLHLANGQPFTLIDESYNANPASMRAAIDTLGGLRAEGGGRRIAILGDMRELGATANELHAALAGPIEAAKIDLVHCCGPHMEHLWRALPPSRCGAYAPSAEELQAAVVADVNAGDIVMIKGSLGTRMGPIVEAFRTRYAVPANAETRATGA